MASFEDKFRELERVFEKLSSKFDSQLLASSSYGFASPGIRSKVGYDDRTLLVKIHLEEYSVSWDVLNQMFSKIGYVEYIEVFAPDSQFHSQVRFQEHGLAAKAFEYFDGRCIYDGCCRMELFLGVPINDCGSHLGTADDICKIEPRDPVVVVEKEPPLVAHVLLDEMPMEVGSEILHDNCTVDFTCASGEVFPSPLTPPIVWGGISISITENWTSEQEFLGMPPKEIHREHNNSNNSMKQITSSSTPTTSKVEALSPSTEKKISEFKEGNGKYSEFHLIDLDGNERSSWMRNCEEWESRALVGYLSYRNLDLHLLDVDNKVDTRQIQSMLMKQHLGSAHEVFEKMSEKEIVDVDDSIGLLSTLGSVFGSMESTGSFVFDPGKSNEFPISTGWVETSLTLVFDPGGTYVLLNEPLFRFKSIGLVASWMCCG